MKEKYVIAQNEKQRESNLKYIAKKCEKEQKEKNLLKRIKVFVISVLQVWAIKEKCSVFSERVCRLFIDEVELFYFNNYFDIGYLRMKHAYLSRMNERKIGIKVPIFLSLIASLIYNLLDNFFRYELGEGLVNPFIEFSHSFLEIIIKNKGKEMNIDIFMGIISCILGAFFIIVVIILIVFWIVVISINVLVDIIYSMNFTKKVAEEYEIEFIQRIINGKEYNAVIEMLDLYANSFYGVISMLSYNYLITNKKVYETIDNLTTTVVEMLMNNPAWGEMEDKEFMLCDKKIFIKSIVHRVYLKINDNNQKLHLEKDKLYLK